MIVWNGMDIIGLIILVIILAILAIWGILVMIGSKCSKFREKRNERLWKKYGDKEENEDVRKSDE